MGMGSLARVGRSAALVVALACGEAQAADLLGRFYVAPAAVGLLADGPNCGVALAHPEWPRVWLGHFQGGLYLRGGEGPNALTWRDLYVCFPSRVACGRFLRQMSAATRGDRFYHRVEGYRTCLPIR